MMQLNWGRLLAEVTSYYKQGAQSSVAVQQALKTLSKQLEALATPSGFSLAPLAPRAFFDRLLSGNARSQGSLPYSVSTTRGFGVGLSAALLAACTPKDLNDLLSPVQIPTTLPETPTETTTPEGSITPSETPTLTPVVSYTPSTTDTPFASSTPELTPTDTPSATPDNTPTDTPDISVTPSFTPAPSSTPSVSPTETPAATNSPTPNAPTATPDSPTLTPSPTLAPTPTTLATTDTPTPEPTPEPTPYPAPIQHDTGDAAFLLQPEPGESMRLTANDSLSSSPDGRYLMVNIYSDEAAVSRHYLLEPTSLSGTHTISSKAKATLTDVNPIYNLSLDTCQLGPDMTQDGKDDAVCILHSTNSTDSILAVHSDIATLEKERESHDTRYQLISESAGRITDILHIGDFDDDGKPDTLVVADHRLSILTKPVTTALNQTVISKTGLVLDIPNNNNSIFAQGFPTLAAVGDVNGDGYSDFLVGNPDATVGDIETAGAAYLVLGRAIPVPSATAAHIENNALKIVYSKTNPKANSLGYAVGGAGDVNHDGLADLALYVMNQGAYSTRIIFGNTDFEMGKTLALDELPLDASLSLYSAPSNALSNEGPLPSYAPFPMDDVTGDGYPDFAVGLPDSSACTDATCDTFIYSGTVYLADLTRRVGNPHSYADWSTIQWVDNADPFHSQHFGAHIAFSDIGNGPRGLITTSLSGVYGFDLW